MTLPGDDDRITPVDELFTYHIFGIPAAARTYAADPASYALEVSGLVAAPLALSLEQLATDFDQVDCVMVLQCMSEIHWGRLELGGPRLLDVLQAAGVQDGAVKLAIHGADGFDSDHALDDIRQEPDAFLLALRMNGAPLTVEHGFPVRLTAAGRYAYKWPKWVNSLQLVDTDYKGHYEGKRRWSDRARRGEPVI